MAKFQIICDAGASIDSEFINNKFIEIIPVYLIADSKRYIIDAKRSNITNQEIYQIIKDKKDFYYQGPLYLDIKNAYERYLREGLDVLVIKSSVSTYFSSDNSNLVKNELIRLYPERKIFFVDSLCLSLGINSVLKIALDSIENDLDVTSTIQNIEQILSSVNQYVVLPRNNNVKTNAFSFFDNHSHRPNFLFQGDNGYLEYKCSFFTSKPAIKRALVDIKKNISNSSKVIISYGDCKSKYIDYIEKYLHKYNIVVKKEPISLTLLSILGSTAIGIVFRKEM